MDSGSIRSTGEAPGSTFLSGVCSSVSSAASEQSFFAAGCNKLHTRHCRQHSVLAF